MAKTLSIIIPTHNRCDVLEKTLRAFERQSAADEILEILVVDDGSSDDTPRTVRRISSTSPLQIRHLSQDQQGLAAARNHGLREASANLILFVDDDIIPRTNLVVEHLRWHGEYPDPAVSIMGRVVWSPEIRPTPFMTWLGNGGPLFNYGGLQPGAQVELYRSYFNNTSLKAAFLRRHGSFDERFRSYGFEDMELAYRLKKQGWKLLYNPDAIGEHYKFVNFAAACKTAKKLAQTRAVFETTEAGLHMKEAGAKIRNSTRYKAQWLLVRSVVPLLAPMKPLIDSYVPLPSSVYQAFYHYYKSR